MPRSKRNRVVSLTKSKPKGRSLKTTMVETLRNAVDEYGTIYAFSFENMRASKFKDIRMHWRDSRIFMGKNSIIKVALGKTVEDEFKDNLRHISEKMEGNVGLIFTKKPREEVLEYFQGLTLPEFAKAGTIPTEDIILQPGALEFPASMIDHFRKLGLVVEIEDTKLILRNTFHVAVKDVPLTPEQARLLVHLDAKIINFSLQLLCRWEDGTFEELL